jgi:hypothetical protein
MSRDFQNQHFEWIKRQVRQLLIIIMRALHMGGVWVSVMWLIRHDFPAIW